MRIALPGVLTLLVLCGCTGQRHHSFLAFNSTSHISYGASSAAEQDRLYLTYRVEGEDAILDSDRVLLRFPGLSLGQRSRR